MISQSRWDDLINIVEGVLLVSNHRFKQLVSGEELEILLNVLKNNTPFQVVPDCCVNKTPNEVTVVAMNDVLLETEHFKVLGDKE